MDYYSRKLLKAMKTTMDRPDNVFSCKADDHDLLNMDTERDVQYSLTPIMVTFHLLQKHDAIEFLDDDKDFFVLTVRALHPYRIRFEDLKVFLYRSFFTPIAVSAITTLVTLWLRGLFR